LLFSGAAAAGDGCENQDGREGLGILGAETMFTVWWVVVGYSAYLQVVAGRFDGCYSVSGLLITF